MVELSRHDTGLYLASQSSGEVRFLFLPYQEQSANKLNLTDVCEQGCCVFLPPKNQDSLDKSFVNSLKGSIPNFEPKPNIIWIDQYFGVHNSLSLSRSTVREEGQFRYKHVTIIIPLNTQFFVGTDGFYFLPGAIPPHLNVHWRDRNKCSTLKIQNPHRIDLTPISDGSLLRLPVISNGNKSKTGCFLGLTQKTNELDLETLDTDIHFYFLKEESGRDVAIESCRYPVLASGFSLELTLNPYQYAGGEESLFTFPPSKEAQPLVSYLRTGHLLPVFFTPGPDARIVFTKRPLHYNCEAQKVVGEVHSCLTLSGTFSLSVGVGNGANPRRGHEILCGASGVETLAFGKENTFGNITFHTDHPALITTTFSKERKSLPPALGTKFPKLIDANGNATTAWVTVDVATGQSPFYNIQPEYAPLHGPDNTFGKNEFLFSEPVPHVFLGNSPDKPRFPLAPLAGLGKDAALLVTFEDLVVATNRRSILEGITSILSESSIKTLTLATPNGFLVEQDMVSGHWNEIRFIQDNKDGPQLRLRATPGETRLAQALRQKNVFLVITRTQSDEKILFDLDSKITVDNWTFSLKLGQDTTPTPILIIKFSGHSILKHVNDINSWAYPKVFNQNPSDVQNSILNFCFSKEKTDNDEMLSKIINDPEFNGVIALNSELGCSGFPAAAACIRGGILGNTLLASYLAVYLCDVETLGGSLSLINSSISGKVQYDKKEIAGGGEDDYGFVVKHFELLFENSELRKLVCESTLLVNKLFGEKVTWIANQAIDGKIDEWPPNNQIPIIGRYEKNGGNDLYTFSAPKDTIISLASGFKDVSCKGLQLSTIEHKSSYTKSRFSISGTLGLRKGTTRCDLLSYHDIPFSNLGILLKYNPNKKVSRTFTFDPYQMALNATDDKNLNGLLANIPLKLKGFMYLNEACDLSKLGFSPAKLIIHYMKNGVPTGESNIIDTDSLFRYGLVFDFGLGSHGGLSQRGDINSALMIGWNNKGYEPVFALKRIGNNKNLDIPLFGAVRFSGAAPSIEILQQVQVAAKNSWQKDETAQLGMSISVDNCVLDFFGESLGGGKDLKTYFFCGKDESQGHDGQLNMKKLGWFMSWKPNQPQSFRYFEVEYLALGQRIAPFGGVLPSTTEKIVQNLLNIHEHASNNKETVSAVDILKPSSDLRTQYDENSDWLFVLRAKLLGTLGHLNMAFVDPSYYGIRLKLTLLGTNTEVEITYQKVTEDIGVYTTEIALPGRTLNLDVISLTLPNLGLSLYTTGDFLINIGFPHMMDFSRSFHLIMATMVGSGGFYIGQLPGVASPPNIPNRKAMAFGFGMRGGWGWHGDYGPLSAGLSLCVYGILEGVLYPSATATEGKFGWEYTLTGRAGFIFELYGAVDFGIVKATVSFCLYGGFAMTLDQNGLSSIIAEGGVSASASVVIASGWSPFGGNWEITISFSYRTYIRKVIHERDKRPLAVTRIRKAIDWDLGGFEPSMDTALTLLFVADITASPQGPTAPPPLFPLDIHAVIFLSIESGEFTRLAQAFVEYVCRATLDIAPNEMVMLTEDDISNVLEKLFYDKTIESSIGIHANKIKDTFKYQDITNKFIFRFFDGITITCPKKQLHNCENTANSTVAYFPMFSDITRVTISDGEEYQKSFRKTPIYTKKEQDILTNYFQSLFVQSKKSAQTKPMYTVDPEICLAEILFQDYFSVLVSTILDKMAETIRQLGKQCINASFSLEQIFTELGESGVAGTAKHLSRFYFHGLRIPEIKDMEVDANIYTSHPLFARNEQQFPITAKEFDTFQSIILSSDNEKIKISDETEWSIDDNSRDMLKKIAASTIKNCLYMWEGKRIHAIKPVSEVERTFVFTRRIATISNKTINQREGMILSMPKDLLDALKKFDKQQSKLAIRFSPANQEDELPNPEEHLFNCCFGTAVNMRLTKHQENVFRISNISEGDCRLLEAVANAHSLTLEGVYLQTKLGLISPLKKTTIARTNLSTEANPEARLGKPHRHSSDLTNTNLSSFIGMLRDCGITNSGGYFLIGELLGSTSKSELGTAFDATLMVLFNNNFKQADVFSPKSYCNIIKFETDLSIVITESHHAKSNVNANKYILEAVTPEFPKHELSVDPDSVGFYALGIKDGEWGRDEFARSLGERYNLIEYSFKQDGDVTLPISPVLNDKFEDKDRPYYSHAIPISLLENKMKLQGRGVGHEVTLHFAQRDIYGNRSNISDKVTLDTGYTDRLLSPSDWPNVSAEYEPAKSADNGGWSFVVRFTFSPPAPETLSSKIRYDKIVANMNRAIAQLQVTNITSIFWQTTLSHNESGLKEIPAGDRFRKDLIALAEAIKLFYTTRKGETFCVEHPLRLKADALPDYILTDALTLSLHLRREKNTVHRQVLELIKEAYEISSIIPAKITSSSLDAIPLTEFAERFSSEFTGLILATGWSEESDNTLYFVRKSVIHAEFANCAPSYFALPPLSTSLISGTYEDPLSSHVDNKELFHASDIDLDNVAREFLESIELYLDNCLKRLNNVDNKANVHIDIFENIMSAKILIAKSLARRLTNISTGEIANEAITKSIEDALLIDLRNAYEIDTAILLKQTNKFQAQEKLELYGKVVTVSNQKNGQTTKLDQPTDNADSSFEISHSKFTDGTVHFLLNWKKDPTHTLYAPLTKPCFVITHLKRVPTPRSAELKLAFWLKLVKQIEVDLSKNDNAKDTTIDVPIILRQYPGIPVLHESIGYKSDNLFAPKWSFEFYYDWTWTKHDDLFFEAEFNSNNNMKIKNESELAKTLIQFSWKYNQIRKLLEDGDSDAAYKFNVLVQSVKAAFNTSQHINAEATSQHDIYRYQYQITRLGDEYKIIPLSLNAPISEHKTEIDSNSGDKRFKICLSELNILRYENINIKLYAKRNAKYHHLFAYATPAKSFSTPLTMSILNQNEYILSDLKCSSADKGGLDLPNKQLNAVFNKLFEGIEGDRRIRLRTWYEGSLIDQVVLDLTPKPLVPLVMTSTIKINTTNYETTFSEEFGKALKTQLADAYQTIIAGNLKGTLWFDLTIFTALSSENLPVLRYTKLKFPLSCNE